MILRSPKAQENLKDCPSEASPSVSKREADSDLGSQVSFGRSDASEALK
jgi:hypothetical protein